MTGTRPKQAHRVIGRSRARLRGWLATGLGVSLASCADATAIVHEGQVDPCTEGSVACAERVELWPSRFLPVHTTHALADRHPSVTTALIVVHGTDRNGDDYFERAVRAVELDGLQREVVVVAPTFQTAEDGPAADEPFWSSGGWKRGHLSSPDGPDPRISSYAALDVLVGVLTDTGAFPNVDRVVVTGHSAGGQVAHRYAAASGAEESASGVDFRYVVANPSTYLYVGPERLIGSTFALPDGSCPDYDEWHYGLEDRNSYASAESAETLRGRLASRDVRILLGAADTLEAQLDVTCGANLQGRHRLERGRVVVDFMDTVFGDHGHVEMLVPGVGHSSSGIYASEVGRDALFR